MNIIMQTKTNTSMKVSKHFVSGYLVPSILMKYLIRWKWKDTMMPIFSRFIKAIKKNNE